MNRYRACYRSECVTTLENLNLVKGKLREPWNTARSVDISYAVRIVYKSGLVHIATSSFRVISAVIPTLVVSRLAKLNCAESSRDEHRS